MAEYFTSLRAYRDAFDEGLEATLFLTGNSVEAYDDERGLTCYLRQHPHEMLEQALDLLGIPWDSA